MFNIMNTAPHYLIVGIDSFIGKSLHNHWNHKGIPATGTTRRADSHQVFLDLLDSSRWPHFTEMTSAVICAASTNMKYCSDNPELTRRINVTGTMHLIEHLINNGVFVVWLSSGAVFNGDQPRYAVDSATSPVTEYGRQKAEVERTLLSNVDSSKYAIVRTSKIV